MRNWGIGIGLLVAGVVVGGLLQELLSGTVGPSNPQHAQQIKQSRSTPEASSSQDLESRLRSVTGLLKECQRENESRKQSLGTKLVQNSEDSQSAEDPRLEEDPFEIALADFQAARFDGTVENERGSTGKGNLFRRFFWMEVEFLPEFLRTISLFLH